MAIPVVQSMDFNLNELLNVVAQQLATAPAHKKGRFYYDTTLNKFGLSDGTAWTYLGATAAFDTEQTQDTVAALFAGSTNVTISYNDSTGAATLSVGANAISNTQVASGAAISADKLANGTSNVIMLLTERSKLAAIAAGATANSSDATLKDRNNHTGTQTASTISDLLAFVNTQIAAVIDTAPDSLNTLNELAAALNDNPNFATDVLASIGLKANLSQISAVGLSGSYADILNKPNFNQTIGDGATTSFTITHGLNTKDLVISVRQVASPFAKVVVEEQFPTANTVVLVFGTAPTVGQYAVSIKG